MKLVFIEEEKRRQESAFSAVGFVYNNSPPDTGPGMDSNLSLPRHLTTSSVDHGEGDRFIPPPGLVIPDGIQVVSLHAIVPPQHGKAKFITVHHTWP